MIFNFYKNGHPYALWNKGAFVQRRDLLTGKDQSLTPPYLWFGVVAAVQAEGDMVIDLSTARSCWFGKARQRMVGGPEMPFSYSKNWEELLQSYSFRHFKSGFGPLRSPGSRKLSPIRVTITNSGMLKSLVPQDPEPGCPAGYNRNCFT